LNPKSNQMADEETGAVAPEESISTPTVAEAPEQIEAEPSGAEQAASEGAEADEGGTQDEQPNARHKGNPFQSRIDELTKIRRQQERRIAELEAAQAVGKTETPAEKAPVGDFDTIVSQRAAEMVQQREMQGRVNSWLKAGLDEFKDDFNERCNTVAALGAQERPEFMQIVTDPDIIPDGHRLVAALADDPAETARILSLPPVQMSAALVKYAGKLAAPKGKPISGAPAPIKPLDGTARASDEPSANDSEEDWFRKRQAQIAARARTGARF
jgi:hypothetical protein